MVCDSTNQTEHKQRLSWNQMVLEINPEVQYSCEAYSGKVVVEREVCKPLDVGSPKLRTSSNRGLSERSEGTSQMASFPTTSRNITKI